MRWWVDRRYVHAQIAEALVGLERLFRAGDVKLSILARHTGNQDAHMLVTECDVKDIRQALDDLEGRGAVWHGPKAEVTS